MQVARPAKNVSPVEIGDVTKKVKSADDGAPLGRRARGRCHEKALTWQIFCRWRDLQKSLRWSSAVTKKGRAFLCMRLYPCCEFISPSPAGGCFRVSCSIMLQSRPAFEIFFADDAPAESRSNVYLWLFHNFRASRSLQWQAALLRAFGVYWCQQRAFQWLEGDDALARMVRVLLRVLAATASTQPRRPR